MTVLPVAARTWSYRLTQYCISTARRLPSPITRRHTRAPIAVAFCHIRMGRCLRPMSRSMAGWRGASCNATHSAGARVGRVGQSAPYRVTRAVPEHRGHGCAPERQRPGYRRGRDNRQRHGCRQRPGCRRAMVIAGGVVIARAVVVVSAQVVVSVVVITAPWLALAPWLLPG